MTTSDAAGLRSAFSWTLFGNAATQLSQWLVIVLIAKWFDPTATGQFALALAIVAPVFMFTNLQLKIVLATDARGQHALRAFVTLRAGMTVTALMLIGAVAQLGGRSRHVVALILAVGLWKSIESAGDLAYGYLQKHERMRQVGVSQATKATLGLAAMMIVTMGLGWGIVAGVLALAGVVLSVTLFYDMPQARALHVPATPHAAGLPSELGHLFALTWPLGAATLMASLAANLPRYAISASLGDEALGHFAAMVYLITAGNNLIGSLTQSVYPRLSRAHVQDRTSFVRLFRWLVGAALGLGVSGLVVALAIGPDILTRVYTADYARHAHVLVWLMVAGIVDYTAAVCVTPLMVARRFRAQLWILGACAATVGALCLWLVPSHGLVGAAWALIAGETVRLLGALTASRGLLRTSPSVAEAIA